MKTAMQELFSQLEIDHPYLFNKNTLTGRQFINDYYKFFELEKQQIIGACDYGKKYHEKFDYTSEQYYKETFNK
jgi:hypothetical protein